MKRIAVFITAFTCLVGAAEFGHAATATNNLTVSASVSAAAGGCSITTIPVNFGTLPGTSLAFAQGSVSVTCGAGAAWTVTLSRGGAPAGSVRGMYVAGVRVVDYELFRTSTLTAPWGDSGFAGTYIGQGVAGVGTGAAQVSTIYGQGSAVAGAPNGNYSDIVVATVNF